MKNRFKLKWKWAIKLSFEYIYIKLLSNKHMLKQFIFESILVTDTVIYSIYSSSADYVVYTKALTHENNMGNLGCS